LSPYREEAKRAVKGEENGDGKWATEYGIWGFPNEGEGGKGVLMSELWAFGTQLSALAGIEILNIAQNRSQEHHDDKQPRCSSFGLLMDYSAI